MTVRAAILARVSTEEQAADDRHSIPMQRAMMERYIVQRDGWELTRTFEILGESAYTDDFSRRPEFEQALRAAEAGEYDVLLVYDMSRFARDQYMTHAAIRRLRHAGVRLVGVFTGVDYTDSPEWAGMEAIFAERSSRDHSRRVQHANDRRHAVGLPTGDIPFGYRRALRTDEHGNSVPDASVPPVIVEEEAETVRWAYRAYLSGHGYLEIAREFNRRGLRPHSKPRRTSIGLVRPANDAFTFTGIQRILSNPFYAGYVNHKGVSAPGRHEPIITDDLWAAAQGKRRRGRRAPHSHGMLSGLTVCHRCHGSLLRQRSANYVYYRERPTGRPVECPSMRKSWRADDLEGQVGEVVRSMALDEEWLGYCSQQARRVAQRQTAPESPKGEEERKRIMQLYIEGHIQEQEVRELLAAYQPKREQVAPEVTLFAGRRFASFGEAWAIFNDSERREMMREVLRSVEVDLLAHSYWVEPQPEYVDLFALRRDFCVKYARQDSGVFNANSPMGRLYSPAELGVAS